MINNNKKEKRKVSLKRKRNTDTFKNAFKNRREKSIVL